MSKHKENYKKVLKNTSVFGGVQIITILASIIKGKIVSVFLGPIGMGVVSLLQAPLEMIKIISGIGLEMSMVRGLSEAYEDHDSRMLHRLVEVSNKLFLYLGTVGAILTMMLSPFLSEWSFGNRDYTWHFFWLSLTVFFATINSGEQAKLRSFQKITHIAKSGVVSSVFGVLIVVPMYYYYGVNGIVPVIIITSMNVFGITWYFSREIETKGSKVSLKDVFFEGSEMIKMGLVLVVAMFIGSLTKFGINIFVGNLGSIKDLGLYTAAISISTRFVGFILEAINIDYFPKLVRAQKDVVKTNFVVNQQIEIVVLLTVPLLILMILATPLIIKVLLSAEFLVITDFIRFVAIGAFFQVLSSNLGYLSFSKNDKYFYLLLEGGMGNLLNFLLTILFYYLWGVNGMGISFSVLYIIYFFVISFFGYKRYSFKYTKNTLKLVTITLVFLLTSFFCTYLEPPYLRLIIGILVFLVSLYFSFKELDKLTGVKNIVLEKINSFRKKTNN
jgi:O-antigen/teichoic acid export membrane protein